MTVVEFEHLLDVYGADRTRWPLASRVHAVTRLAADPRARQLLAESEALETVLLAAPEPATAEVAALADRIMAAMSALPSAATPLVPVQPMRAVEIRRPSPSAIAAQRSQGPQVRRDSRRNRVAVVPGWQNVALLAASLVIGMFVGQSQWGQAQLGQSELGARAVPVFEAMTGLTLPAATDQLALADIHLEPIEDD